MMEKIKTIKVVMMDVSQVQILYGNVQEFKITVNVFLYVGTHFK